jgi:hypothetical protein
VETRPEQTGVFDRGSSLQTRGAEASTKLTVGGVDTSLSVGTSRGSNIGQRATRGSDTACEMDSSVIDDVPVHNRLGNWHGEDGEDDGELGVVTMNTDGELGVVTMNTGETVLEPRVDDGYITNVGE